MGGGQLTLSHAGERQFRRWQITCILHGSKAHSGRLGAMPRKDEGSDGGMVFGFLSDASA